MYHLNFHLTYNMLLHYLVKFEIQTVTEFSKMLPNFHVERDNQYV